MKISVTPARPNFTPYGRSPTLRYQHEKILIIVLLGFRIVKYLSYIVYVHKNLIMKVKDIINQTLEERNTKTVYVPVSDNIYHTGHSYRVRVRQKNVLISKNFKNKKQAIQFRNGMIV